MKTIIELVKTTQGYAVLEDGHEVNKLSNRNTKEKQLSAAPKSMLYMIKNSVNKILPFIRICSAGNLSIYKNILLCLLNRNGLT